MECVQEVRATGRGDASSRCGRAAHRAAGCSWASALELGPSVGSHVGIVGRSLRIALASRQTARVATGIARRALSM